MDIKDYLKEKKTLIDSFLESYFSAPLNPKTLHDSMVYSLSAGGKRIRPVLCIASYEACAKDNKVKAEDIIPYASALEFIHTYSLIHDDLPAMDNDDLRRGKPTNHKVFGEGMAILAGDGLLTEAFYLLSNNTRRACQFSPYAVLKVIREIAMAAGIHGMVGGQAQDLLSENAEPDAETLSFIHSHKTAALITVSVRSGGILANCSDQELFRLTKYGENIGLAFQVIDDILDVEGETEVIGKPKGSDEKKKKMTYPKLYGIDKSREKARELINGAINSLETFNENAEPLRAIARYLLERKS
ncbi:MAG: polyprenyl synthetase family protein [Thermodesulfovibrionales bacterium]|jgi:geranylgeranyl diphosphate synthase type II|nr:polyprenyl synthetase family protein [Thermodesulfovibrionales bacterium]